MSCNLALWTPLGHSKQRQRLCRDRPLDDVSARVEASPGMVRQSLRWSEAGVRRVWLTYLSCNGYEQEPRANRARQVGHRRQVCLK